MSQRMPVNRHLEWKGATAQFPNDFTSRTLTASKQGKGVKRFASKKKLFADLGL
jgi:hypothetical protein